MSIYSLLADFIVVAHLAYVGFVVLGLVFVLLGIVLRWEWTRNLWFRSVHLAMILIVVAEALLGIVCPLTTWEFQLREAAGQTPEQGAFLARWAHDVLFIDAPVWTFTVAYVLFGLLVLATWRLAPPRWRKPLRA